MKKLHHLQALRGIAANLVVLDHILSTLIRYGKISPTLEGVAWHLGEVGVGIFFVISGFIMAYTSHGEAGKPGAPYLFLEKRFIRVVPLYWLATLLAFAMLFAVHKPEGVANLLKSLLFIPYFSGSLPAMRPVLGQGWTINYEIFFYAIFAVSLLLKGRRSLYFLVVMFAGLAICGQLLGSGWGAIVDSYTRPIILLFLIGVLLGWFCVTRMAVLPVKRPLLLASILIVGNVGFYYAFEGRAFVDWLCALLSIATVITCTFCPDGDDGPVARAWETLGDGSYSTYLFHTFILAVLNRLAIGEGAASVLVYALTGLIGANIVGIGVYRLLERPLTRRLRDMIHASRRSAMLSSTR